jgi:hypothetical protein
MHRMIQGFPKGLEKKNHYLWLISHKDCLKLWHLIGPSLYTPVFHIYVCGWGRKLHIILDVRDASTGKDGEIRCTLVSMWKTIVHVHTCIQGMKGIFYTSKEVVWEYFGNNLCNFRLFQRFRTLFPEWAYVVRGWAQKCANVYERS